MLFHVLVQLLDEGFGCVALPHLERLSPRRGGLGLFATRYLRQKNATADRFTAIQSAAAASNKLVNDIKSSISGRKSQSLA